MKHWINNAITACLVACSILASADELAPKVEPSHKQPSIYEKYVTEKKLASVKKITTFRFHSWSSLNQEFLIISASFNKPYLIQLKSRCFNLNFAHNIKVNHQRSTLNAKFDSITVPDHPQIPCHIESIYPLTREQAKEIKTLDKP